ncbi:MAG TPA: DUF5652 family protein [Candidatus Nanoarchaeia archaeon]|nr:DUF5652 family protein [Candidatus Nanoarchaeia archaeon]
MLQSDYTLAFQQAFATLVWFIVVLSLWELAWKGVALWRAARNSHRWWFVAILLLNTVGILPMVYYLFFSGRQKQLLGTAAATKRPKGKQK